jgi:hypothetical protein
VLGSSWRHAECAVAFRAGYSCTTKIAPTSGSKGRGCNRRYSTRLLGFDPDSLHVATTCSFPPGIFGGDSTAFFRRVVCAVERNSTQAHRSCLLIGPLWAQIAILVHYGVVLYDRTQNIRHKGRVLTDADGCRWRKGALPSAATCQKWGWGS